MYKYLLEICFDTGAKIQRIWEISKKEGKNLQVSEKVFIFAVSKQMFWLSG